MMFRHERAGTYAGAEWVMDSLLHIEKRVATREKREPRKAEELMSPLGRDVADLMGEWLYGIYHFDEYDKVNWGNPHRIEIRYHGGLATFDFNELTRLVFLSHHRCIRVEIRPRSARYMTVLFHRRKRKGTTYERHPTLQEAVDWFYAVCTLRGIDESATE